MKAAYREKLRLTPRLHVLDGETADIGGVRFGGVCGVIGNPERPFRRTEAEHGAAVERSLSATPDVLVVHQGPHIEGLSKKSSVLVGQLLDQYRPGLCICGHDPWERRLVTLPGGTQVLNVDHRVVCLMRENSGKAN
jgi:Icc-related predicted phosphoesterase